MTDNKRRIMELAEEKSLFGDEEAVEEAKTILLDPIRRIDAELSWFPELGNMSAQEIIQYYVDNLESQYPKTLEGISRINHNAKILKSFTGDNEALDCLGENAIANGILHMAWGFRDLDVEKLTNQINQHRWQGGFPIIADKFLFTEKIDARRSEVMGIIWCWMDSIPIDALLKTLYLISGQDTNDGKMQASILVEDIVRFFENNMMTREFMESEPKAIQDLLESIKQSVNENQVYVMNLIKALGGELQKWQNVVAPMQIVAASHGKEHIVSSNVLYNIRDISIELNNEYNKPELSIKLMDLIGRNAADKYIPSFRKVRYKDKTALQQIMNDRAEAEKEQREFERSIFYSTELGLFNNKFQISVKGIEWRGRVTPLNEITGVSWGTIQTTMNGFTVSRDCKIVYQTASGIEELNPNYEKYIEITERMWNALAIPIYGRMMKRIIDGETLSVGNIKFNDNGVYLFKPKWFSSEERYYSWKESFTIYNGNGTFVIKKKGEDCSASASYRDDMNTHIFEFAIRQFFKYFNRNNPRLSSQFKHKK